MGTDCAQNDIDLQRAEWTYNKIKNMTKNNILSLDVAMSRCMTKPTIRAL